jgi:lactate permease
MIWAQNYNPLDNGILSTVVAALPVVVLLSSIALFKLRIHRSALLGLAVALAIAIFVYGMPVKSAAASTVYGAAYGLFPIGWIILNLIFLYQLTVQKGLFAVLRGSLATVAPDQRIQVILIAFSFGAFFEGAAGFGTPVAVTAAILLQLGFKPLPASGLSLIANTAPVAFGSLGTPIIALSKVADMDIHQLSAMVGRQLPFFSLMIPFWVVWAMAGFRGMLGVWPAALTAGAAFAIPQFLVSNYHGPWLVDVVASVSSMAALVVLLKFWRPKTTWRMDANDHPAAIAPLIPPPRAKVVQAWLPWLLLSVTLFLWGLPMVKAFLNGVCAPEWPVPGLHQLIVRGPLVALPGAAPEKAIFSFNALSATGTAILVAALLSGFIMGFKPRELLATYGKTIRLLRLSLITIAAMLALGHVTKYSGADATLGLALAKTGALYPFFGTLLGWLGVALTGSDTASNVLFGSLQRITAEHTHISPILMGAANSSGGVMGKMIDAQSIVVASTATNWYGHEGEILRFVFFHSLVLAALVGCLVYLQAYVPPFIHMVVP